MIGGNVDMVLKVGASKLNEIGEDTFTYKPIQTIHGYLDLLSGNSNYSTINTKLEDSTHLFICDVIPLLFDEKDKKRLVAEIKGKQYDVKYIDNPMDIDDHLEFFLKHLE